MDFPPDKIHLFERRFENGYDVYTDREYVAWLQAAESEFSVAALFLVYFANDRKQWIRSCG